MKISSSFAKTLAIAGFIGVAAAANAQNISSQFVNLDFDSGGVSNPFKGFDAPSSPEIIGWNNLNNVAQLNDAGVQGPGAWWAPYQNQAAFMSSGDGAYNLSTYTIAAGDTFSVDFFAKRWNLNETAAWTVTLFYGTSANVIGTYTTPGNLPFDGNNQSLAWAEYTTTPIVATDASVGSQLGVLFVSSGPNHANLDEVSVSVTPVPEPSTMALAIMGGFGVLMMKRRFKKS